MLPKGINLVKGRRYTIGVLEPVGRQKCCRFVLKTANNRTLVNMPIKWTSKTDFEQLLKTGLRIG
jgi:hypothetical protein